MQMEATRKTIFPCSNIPDQSGYGMDAPGIGEMNNNICRIVCVVSAQDC